MCVPGVDSQSSVEGAASAFSSYAWGKLLEPLGSGGVYLSQVLAASARASGNDWIAHSTADKIQLTYESGATVEMNAADADPAMLAAYGYAYSDDFGVYSTRKDSEPHSEQKSNGLGWTRVNGTLVPNVLVPEVTGQVVGWALDAAVPFAGSASVLTNPAFDDLLASNSDGSFANLEKKLQLGSIPKPGFDDSLASPPGDNLAKGHYVTKTYPSMDAFQAANQGVTGNNFSLTMSTDSEAVVLSYFVASPTDSSSSSNSFARDLAEEHARNYSAGVAQADAAQQSEYLASQAAKDAANQSRINQNMSQIGASNASGAGSGQGVPAAPGYGPGDVAASGLPGPRIPAAPGYGPGDAAASGHPFPGASTTPETGSRSTGMFDRQNFSKDGRVVPNIFKVINQDLWTGWGKSSGADAAITFPFIMAMSGAVFLPQAINDIPNIPTLLATALTEWDNGNWGDALEAAGDGLGALGMAGELAEGLGALRGVEGGVGEAAAETMDFSMPGGRLGGKLYPRAELPNLKANLASRGIELRVGNKFVPQKAAAAFDGVERVMVFRDNPTILEIEHEMAHLEHFEKIGAEAYNNSQVTTRLMKEQFVFDKLSGSDLWETLTDKERILSVEYIEELGGTR